MYGCNACGSIHAYMHVCIAHAWTFYMCVCIYIYVYIYIYMYIHTNIAEDALLKTGSLWALAPASIAGKCSWPWSSSQATASRRLVRTLFYKGVQTYDILYAWMLMALRFVSSHSQQVPCKNDFILYTYMRVKCMTMAMVLTLVPSHEHQVLCEKIHIRIHKHVHIRIQMHVYTDCSCVHSWHQNHDSDSDSGVVANISTIRHLTVAAYTCIMGMALQWLTQWCSAWHGNGCCNTSVST
jgi:hypothetical protein